MVAFKGQEEGKMEGQAASAGIAAFHNYSYSPFSSNGKLTLFPKSLQPNREVLEALPPRLIARVRHTAPDRHAPDRHLKLT